MLTTSLLAATLLLAPPSNFDGLKIEVVSTPKEPVINGPAKTWEGSMTSTIFDVTATTVFYGLTVTDLSTLPQKPSEDRVFSAHEHQARTRKPFVAQNFRRSVGAIGSHKLLVLSGSVIAPDANGRPQNAYWVSFVFSAGDKVYEFNQVSKFDTEYKEALRRISEMKLQEGENRVAAAGVPKDVKGEFTISGIPFILTSSITPFASTVSPREPAFGDAQYTAMMVAAKGPSLTYRLREMKPDDKRDDTQIFRELVESFVKAKDIPAEKYVVKDGSGTAEFEYQEGGKDYVAYARFEHDGKWIGAVIGYALKTEAAGLKDTTLRRMPDDE